MAFLADIPCEIKPAAKRSPFWRKTYGGYTQEQLGFFERNLRQVNGKRICDPMSGQAYSTCQMAWAGANVRLCDINVGALALATLRDPLLIQASEQLSKDIAQRFRQARGNQRKRIKREHFNDWIPPQTKCDFQSLSNVFELDRTHSPFQIQSKFWRQPPINRLALGLAVLAARSMTCFRTSDNSTWLKKGGITPGITTWEALNDALDSWVSFANSARGLIKRSGRVHIETWNCEAGCVPGTGNAMDAVVVSPPYANRLDYSLLWGPELAVVAEIFDGNVADVKAAQMGTTVVRGKWPLDEQVRKLPKEVFQAIQNIRQDEAKASERYYYPFFANYALSLADSVRSWSNMIAKNGLLMVILRDTVRKDHLFPSDAIVRHVAKKCGLWQINADESPLIIRSHIGLLRHRRAKSSLHGLAQREWMLAFIKA